MNYLKKIIFVTFFSCFLLLPSLCLANYAWFADFESVDYGYMSIGNMDLERISSERFIDVQKGDFDLNGMEDWVIDFGQSGLALFKNSRNWIQLATVPCEQFWVQNLDNNPIEEIVVDFGDEGLSIYYNRDSWESISSSDLESLEFADIDANGSMDIVLDFGTVGIYFYYNNNQLSKVTGNDPEEWILGNIDSNNKLDLVTDLGEDGIFVYYNGDNYSNIADLNPIQMSIANINNSGSNDLILNFGELGLSVFEDNSDWISLSSATTTSFSVLDLDSDESYDLYVQFSNGDLYFYYDGETWSKILASQPEQYFTGFVNDNEILDLIVDLGTEGLFIYYDHLEWEKLNSSDIDDLIFAQIDSNPLADLVIDFGSLGLYVYLNSSTWTKISAGDSRESYVLDIDSDDLDEILVYFPDIPAENKIGAVYSYDYVSGNFDYKKYTSSVLNNIHIIECDCDYNFLTATCSETDLGKQYYSQGSIEGKNLDEQEYTYQDECIDTMTLREYYCQAPDLFVDNKNNYGYKDRNCPDGCSSGKCNDDIYQEYKIKDYANELNLDFGSSVYYCLLDDFTDSTCNSLRSSYGISKDQSFLDLTSEQFNSVSSVGSMCPQPIHANPPGDEDEYNFEFFDAFVDYGNLNNLYQKAIHLVWHYYTSTPLWWRNPDYQPSYTAEQWGDALVDHVTDIMARNKGEIDYYNVINESIFEEGMHSDGSVYYREYALGHEENTPFVWMDKIGPEYIDIALNAARAADPDAKLIVNDNWILLDESMSSIYDYNKIDGFYLMISDLVERGIPIDAVGFQAHVLTNYFYFNDNDPVSYVTKEKIKEVFQRFADLDLEVHLTELDVRFKNEEVDDYRTAGILRNIIEACVEVPACTNVTLWGFTDKYSTMRLSYPDQYPGLFDTNLEPKVAYYEILDLFHDAYLSGDKVRARDRNNDDTGSDDVNSNTSGSGSSGSSSTSSETENEDEDIGQEDDVEVVTVDGINLSAYVNSETQFKVLVSKSGEFEEYSLKLENLNISTSTNSLDTSTSSVSITIKQSLEDSDTSTSSASLGISTNTASTSIQTEPIKFEIEQEDSILIDLDGDSIDDIKIELRKIHDDRIEISISCLMAEEIVEKKQEEENTEKQLEKEVLPDGLEVELEENVIPIKITNDNLYQRLQGRIMLKTEDEGRAFYISTTKKEMYYLNRPDDAFKIMSKQGIGVTTVDLEKIPIALIDSTEMDTDKDGLPDIFEDAIGTNKTNIDTDGDGYTDEEELLNGYSPKIKNKKLEYDNNFSEKQKGKILLQVQNHGEAWYVNPDNKKKYYLGKPINAFQIMKYLSLGISNKNFDSLNK